MKAKDTVLNPECGFHHSGHCSEMDRQAGISFKAGYNQCHLDDTDCMKDTFDTGRQEGRMEVVEWVRENLVVEGKPVTVGDSTYLRFSRPVILSQWQAKLKSWGIE